MADDLNVLFPGRELTVGGETLKVMPLTFGQLPKATKLLQSVAQATAAANVISFGKGENGEVQFAIASDWPARLIDLLAEGGESLLEFLAFAVGKERSWFDGLDMDDGVSVAKTVFEVNGDFFVRRVLPKLGLMAVPATDGETSSADSSPQATAEPTSTVTH